LKESQALQASLLQDVLVPSIVGTSGTLSAFEADFDRNCGLLAESLSASEITPYSHPLPLPSTPRSRDWTFPRQAPRTRPSAEVLAEYRLGAPLPQLVDPLSAIRRDAEALLAAVSAKQPVDPPSDVAVLGAQHVGVASSARATQGTALDKEEGKDLAARATSKKTIADGNTTTRTALTARAGNLGRVQIQSGQLKRAYSQGPSRAPKQ